MTSLNRYRRRERTAVSREDVLRGRGELCRARGRAEGAVRARTRPV